MLKIYLSEGELSYLCKLLEAELDYGKRILPNSEFISLKDFIDVLISKLSSYAVTD